MEKKCHLESKKCHEKPREPLTSSESIVKRDNGYLHLLCNTVIKKGIKNYVNKDLIHPCLLVRHAINNSNLNLSWIGMIRFMPKVHSLAQSARRISRGKIT